MEITAVGLQQLLRTLAYKSDSQIERYWPTTLHRLLSINISQSYPSIMGLLSCSCLQTLLRRTGLLLAINAVMPYGVMALFTYQVVNLSYCFELNQFPSESNGGLEFLPF
jgi:hypothetical protein